MGGATKYFLKIFLGHEYFLKRFVKPSGPQSYILNVHSLMTRLKRSSSNPQTEIHREIEFRFG